MRALDYERISMAALYTHATAENEHQDAAARAYVGRICDLALEWQMHMSEPGPALPSTAACFGDGTGASTKEPDVMFSAYVKGITHSYWHDRARRALKRIPDRARLAILIRQRKVHPTASGSRWQRSYADIVKDIGPYAQEMGWPPGVAVHRWFETADAIKSAAARGRLELLMLSKAGAV